MAADLTTIQIHQPTKKRFKKLLVQDRKKRQERKLVNEDFLIRLMDVYESSQS